MGDGRWARGGAKGQRRCRLHVTSPSYGPLPPCPSPLAPLPIAHRPSPITRERGRRILTGYARAGDPLYRLAAGRSGADSRRPGRRSVGPACRGRDRFGLERGSSWTGGCHRTRWLIPARGVAGRNRHADRGRRRIRRHHLHRSAESVQRHDRASAAWHRRNGGGVRQPGRSARQ